jgi:hypothetical protein
MELNIGDKPCLIFNMDETEFPPNALPLKIVTMKGAEDVKFTNVERGENMTCCKLRASGAFILPFVIFKGFVSGKCTSRIYPQNLKSQ